MEFYRELIDLTGRVLDAAPAGLVRCG